MSRWPSVSSSRLGGRNLILRDGVVVGATLFPLFDRQGAVYRVMVIDAASSDIRFFDPAETCLRIPLWGPIRVEPGPAGLRALTDKELRAVRDLWHFDPGRLLSASKYDGSETAEILKATNSFERFPWSISRVYYWRDLSRTAWVLRQNKQGIELKRFPRDALPEESRSRPPARRVFSKPGAWRLDPFWMRTER
jgi:hypothetical protein